MADGWETADRPPVYRLQQLPPPDTRRPAFVHLGLPQNLCPPGGARALIRHGPGQSQSIEFIPIKLRMHAGPSESGITAYALEASVSIGVGGPVSLNRDNLRCPYRGCRGDLGAGDRLFAAPRGGVCGPGG